MLVWIACLCGSAVGQTPTTAPTTASATAVRVAQELPKVSFEDVVLLFKTARRSLHDKLGGLPEQPARYSPPALRDVKSVLHATLRLEGGVIAEAQTQEMPLVDGAVAAGAMLGQTILSKKLKASKSGDACGLELEWVGPPDYVAAANDELGRWSDELLHCFEPGVEGIGVEFRGRRGWTRPSLVISLNYSPDLALQAAEKVAGLTQIEKQRYANEVRYYRFRTRHAWQAAASVRPTILTRGATYVSPETITAENLDAAILRIGKYLRYRQNGDGWYSEEYLPSVDRYTKGNSAKVQMHALQGLAAYAAWTSDPQLADAAAKGITRSAYFLTPLVVPKDAPSSPPASAPATTAPVQTTQAGKMLAFPGHADYLEVSARLLAAMLDLPGRTEFDAHRLSVADALLASQDEDGRLEISFQPRDEQTPEDAAAAGLALWSLANSGISRGDPRIGRALERGQRHYQDWWAHSGDYFGAVAVSRGLALGYVLTNDARASDLVFRTLDRIAERQLSPANCVWPELYGAIDMRQPGLVGVDTATYLSALVDGLMLSQGIGDKERLQRYRPAVASAARFVLQLEFHEAGCYYVRSRIDALGGIRTSPWSNAIRADHVAEALMSLMQARRALFGPHGR